MALFTHNQDSDVQACGAGSLDDVNLVCVNEGKGIEQLDIQASNTTKKNINDKHIQMKYNCNHKNRFVEGGKERGFKLSIHKVRMDKVH